MILLQATNIEKRYGSEVILNGANMTVQTGERVGLVGVNGAGKSTFLRILIGDLLPDGGDVHLHRGVTLGYQAQTSSLQEDVSVMDALRSVFADLYAIEQRMRELEHLMGDPTVMADETEFARVAERYARLTDAFQQADGYAIEARIRGVLHGLDFPPETHDQGVATLSGGQKTRLALGKLLLSAPDVLILDEPTNYLDIRTLNWLEGYLQSYSGAILVVSHDRYFLDALVSTIYELNLGITKRYVGNYQRFVEQKAQDLAQAEERYEAQQAEIARIEDFIRRNIARASTSGMAKSRQKMLARMEHVALPRDEAAHGVHFSFEAKRQSGHDVLAVEDGSLAVAGRPLCENIELRLSRGERVALIGPNGVGKTSLLRVIAGAAQLAGGELRMGVGVDIGYYDQEQQSLSPQKTALDEVWDTFPQLDQTAVRTALGAFLFTGEDVFKRIADLSGGERSRVALSKLMLLDANLLLLDEPTNHLDLLSKEALEAALEDYDGTLLFVSHDRYFINKIATRVVELSPTGTRSFLGNYDDYLARTRDLEVEQSVSSDALSGSPTLRASTPRSFESTTAASARPNERTSGNRNRAGASSLETDAPGSTTGSGSPLSAAAMREESKRRAREERMRATALEQLEAAISGLEKELETLSEVLGDPDTFSDAERAKQAAQDYETKRMELEDLYAKWEDLAAQGEA